MAQRPTNHSGGWAYVSLISALPGRSLDNRFGLLLQAAVFEGVAIGLVIWYDLCQALPIVTVAIAIATVGSGLMVMLSTRIQDQSPPHPYRRILFDSSIDIAMGLIAFIALVTYLLVQATGPRSVFLVRYLGDPLPALGVGFALLVGWDLTYRIGTGWWASITGLWRTIVYRSQFDSSTRSQYVRIDLLNIAFAALQLFLVPFVSTDQLLTFAILGHVGAVFVVSSLSVTLLLYH